jgi:hypothetical protein
MNLGTFYLPKETMLAIMHGIVDGNITEDSVIQNPNNGFSSEVVRFLKDYLKVKPDNLKHTDIRVLS